MRDLLNSGISHVLDVKRLGAAHGALFHVSCGLWMDNVAACAVLGATRSDRVRELCSHRGIEHRKGQVRLNHDFFFFEGVVDNQAIPTQFYDVVDDASNQHFWASSRWQIEEKPSGKRTISKGQGRVRSVVSLQAPISPLVDTKIVTV